MVNPAEQNGHWQCQTFRACTSSQTQRGMKYKETIQNMAMKPEQV